ncbi:hypothetical protein [Enterococcus faecalis]|uniref:hypothetical protein n=1 Tax=Enterococcus faecalis TaxID=1351 RepID=UPI0037706C82
MKETNLSDNELLTAIEKTTETLFISEELSSLGNSSNQWKDTDLENELSFKLNEDMLMGSSLKSKS